MYMPQSSPVYSTTDSHSKASLHRQHTAPAAGSRRPPPPPPFQVFPPAEPDLASAPPSTDLYRQSWQMRTLPELPHNVTPPSAWDMPPALPSSLDPPHSPQQLVVVERRQSERRPSAPDIHEIYAAEMERAEMRAPQYGYWADEKQPAVPPTEKSSFRPEISMRSFEHPPESSSSSHRGWRFEAKNSVEVDVRNAVEAQAEYAPETWPVDGDRYDGEEGNGGIAPSAPAVESVYYEDLDPYGAGLISARRFEGSIEDGDGDDEDEDDDDSEQKSEEGSIVLSSPVPASTPLVATPTSPNSDLPAIPLAEASTSPILPPTPFAAASTSPIPPLTSLIAASTSPTPAPVPLVITLPHSNLVRPGTRMVSPLSSPDSPMSPDSRAEPPHEFDPDEPRQKPAEVDPIERLATEMDAAGSSQKPHTLDYVEIPPPLPPRRASRPNHTVLNVPPPLPSRRPTQNRTVSDRVSSSSTPR
ncbi:hypothetical protein BC938DRAFT_478079 [Jimgerdemannia flammicorona]|uniref:Uncharacterized protein n=1 Tax=Jimgerdemannia flammicorona TaxID=994334 RepID=A0A433QNE6_9FUNG|nr:hypothetical protein BC938DRAFT_478079 [Jimgerdemannia flammicorona]